MDISYSTFASLGRLFFLSFGYCYDHHRHHHMGLQTLSSFRAFLSLSFVCLFSWGGLADPYNTTPLRIPIMISGPSVASDLPSFFFMLSYSLPYAIYILQRVIYRLTCLGNTMVERILTIHRQAAYQNKSYGLFLVVRRSRDWSLRRQRLQ